AGGWPWAKHFAFPLSFLLLAVPWPARMEAIAQPLMRADATVTSEICSALDIPAIQSGNLIEISVGLIGIEEACSGIRSLQATLMLSLFFGEFFMLSVSRRWMLIVIAAVAAFVFNVGRTVVLVLV